MDAAAAAQVDIGVKTVGRAISRVNAANPVRPTKAATIAASRAAKATSVASVAGGVVAVVDGTAAMATAAEAIAAHVQKDNRAAEQSNATVRAPHDCLITREMNAPPR